MKRYVAERAALEENARLLQEAAGEAAFYAVVKGDGYGLGVQALAGVLRGAGVTRFAVTEPDEARALRESGPEDEEILMLRATSDPEELEALLSLRVTATIGTQEDAVALNGIAGRLGVRARAHIAFDTGMGRYGFLPEELQKAEAVYDYMPNIEVTGVYTHFSCAFCSKKKTLQQFAAFEDILARLRADGHATGVAHCANSSALLLYPPTRLDAVRVGSALLGRLSIRTSLPLRRVGYAEASVEELRTLPRGATVGYGAGYRTRAVTQIAVLGVGWWHGFGVEKGRDLWRFSDTARGCLSLLKAFFTRKKLTVELSNRRCRVLGHVGMLHTVVDVTGLAVQQGDVARLEVNPLLAHGLPVEYR